MTDPRRPPDSLSFGIVLVVTLFAIGFIGLLLFIALPYRLI